MFASRAKKGGWHEVCNGVQDRIAGNRTEEEDNNDSNNTVICAVNDAANVKIEVKNCKINVYLEK